MAFYKIKNITNLLGKRDINKNKTLSIDFNNKFEKTTFTLKVNDVLYISLPTIPINLHQLRMKSFITITQISENEYLHLTGHKNNVKLELERKLSEIKTKTEKKNNKKNIDTNVDILPDTEQVETEKSTTTRKNTKK